MGGKSNAVGVVALLLLIVAIADADTPPGIANNPSHARCLIKKYKMCYNLEHVCPKFCPDSCTVECVSCKPICGPGSTPPPEEATPPTSTGGEGKSPPPSEDDGKGQTPPPSDDGKGKGDDGKSSPPSEGKGDSDGKGKGNDGGDDKPSPPSEGKGDDDGKGKGDDGKSSPPSEGKGDNDGKGKGNDGGDDKPSPPSEGKGDDDGKGKGDDGKSSPPSEGKGDNDGKGKGNDGGDDKPSPPSEGKGDDDGKGKGGDGKSSPPPPTPSSPPPTSYPPPSPTPSPPQATPPSPAPTPPTPTPPPPTPTTPPTTPPPSLSPTPPTPSTPTTPPTTPPYPTPTPPTSTPSTPPTTPPSSPTPTPPTPSIPTTPPTTPPTSTPSTPTPPATQTPPTPPASPPMSPAPVPPAPPGSYVPTPSESGNGQERHRCKNKKYTQCYGVEHVCPASCPSTCEIDCVTCKPVCKCDMPGAVCQDPRFIGGDGITFYFHGKRDRDFCLVTDPNLHINAHFIGRRNQNMKRDFTWVQSIAILFGDHQLFLAAQKTAAWDSAVDRFSLAFDGEPIAISTAEGATWKSAALPTATVTRDSDTNSVFIEVEGLLTISAKVVPITIHESRVHNYGITEEDCFAHLELGFKFFSLNANVNGVLGQTYRENYVSRVKMGVAMPVLGGEREFAVSNIFAADCAASLFQRLPENDEAVLELPSMKCGTGIDGRGVVCKR